MCIIMFMDTHTSFVEHSITLLHSVGLEVNDTTAWMRELNDSFLASSLCPYISTLSGAPGDSISLHKELEPL